MSSAGPSCEPRPIDSCFAWDLLSGAEPLPGGVILRSSRWVVEHCIGPLGVGTLIVKPIRHVEGVGELTEEEAAEMGLLLRRTSAVVRDLTGAEQVYNCLWSRSGGRPGHIHFVVQPVTREQVVENEVYGPALQMAMFTRDEVPDPDDVARFAARAREYLEQDVA